MNAPLNADQLATTLTSGGAGWMVASVAAVLPILWSFTLILHFARPYIIRFLRRLTLRFGGDVWWLSYVLFRDGLLVITLGLSMVFLMPNFYLTGDGLPIPPPSPWSCSSGRSPSSSCVTRTKTRGRSAWRACS